MRIISFLLLVISFSSILDGQSDNTNSTGFDEINNFKNGAAVVRLYMNKPKVDLLKKSIAGATSPKEKNELEKILNTHLQERQNYKNKVIQAFSDEYNFSKLYFIHDYDILRLKSGERTSLFLNEQGDLDPSITMTEDYYLIFARGQNDDQVELITPDNRPLPASFPIKYNRGIGSIFRLIFQPKDKLSESVEKMNRALVKYLQNME